MFVSQQLLICDINLFTTRIHLFSHDIHAFTAATSEAAAVVAAVEAATSL